MTNSSSSFLLLVNRYAASGFSLALMNCIESSTLLTFTKEKQDLLNRRISPMQIVLSTDYKQNFLQISCLGFVPSQNDAKNLSSAFANDFLFKTLYAVFCSSIWADHFHED